MEIDFLTIDDIPMDGKTVLVRVDINTPIDPHTQDLMELNRIKEASVTIKSLPNSKVVIASHQGRVGRPDYVSLIRHCKAMSEVLGKRIRLVEDVFGEAACEAVKSLHPGDVLMLENLRFAAEENFEFSPEDAARTHMVSRLSRYLDACVLDAFPTAHRGHPSIIGFAERLPTCAGRLVTKELKSLKRVMLTSKAPYTAVLGGAKVQDRLEAIDALIENGKADNVLLTGLIGQVFLRAANKIPASYTLGQEAYVERARRLLSQYTDHFYLPEDVAVEGEGGERRELATSELDAHSRILDIGEATIKAYSKIIRSSGTVFMSGPAGFFERPGFEKGTNELLLAAAGSLGTTVVSGGHLSAALEKVGVKEWVDHVSTSGGALVMFLAGKQLPLIEALRRSAARFRSGVA